MWSSAVKKRQQGKDHPKVQLVRHAVGNTAADASRGRIAKRRDHDRRNGTAGGSGQRCRRRDQDAVSKEETVWKFRKQESGMTEKGLRKCRAVDGEENQNQVSHRLPRALGNRCRDFHIAAAPATTAMAKWKSKSRILTLPQRLPCLYQIKKRKEINPNPKLCPSGSSQDWNMLRQQVDGDAIHEFRPPVHPFTGDPRIEEKFGNI